MMLTTLQLEIAKFLIVGTFNFVITFCVYFYLIKVLHINYILALCIAWLVGIVNSYLCNAIWVFKSKKCVFKKEQFRRHTITNGITFLFSLIILKLIVDITKADPLYVQFILIPIITIANFLASKFWSFKPQSIK